MAKPKITVVPWGPFVVTGLERLDDAAGQRLPVQEDMDLCRCGYSATKPFCDGAHGPYHFTGEARIDLAATRGRAYTGQTVTVQYNEAICAHAGDCTRGLPEVFNTSRRPWIAADGADPERVIAAVRACPSGALAYTTTANEPAADADKEPKITVLKDGPLAVDGAVELDGCTWAGGASRERYTLCRCGASRATPFCDGSHAEVGFRDG